MVSVLCQTYNHGEFIEQCLNGIMMQETDFPFEVLIHDDASTDNTAEIIKRFELQYPQIIKPIYQVVNQHSQNKKITSSIQTPRAKGKYIAICEGDDYWIDPLKLQRQVDFLEENNEYVAVAENGLVKNHIKNTEYLFNEDVEHDMCIEEMIIKRRFPTASLVFRMWAIKNMHHELKYYIDTLLSCYLARKGKFRYFTNVSSVYNRGMQGVVESTDKLKWAQKVENWNLELIRLFSNSFYDKQISINNIWDHYWVAFEKKIIEKQYRQALTALYKCYRYDFSKSTQVHFSQIKDKSKYYIKSKLLRLWQRLLIILGKKFDHPDFYKPAKKFGLVDRNRTPQLIVSLTSYPERMPTIHFTLHTLLNQSCKPDKLILWLAAEQFPGKEKNIPRKVKALKKYGLSIKWCDDMRSYKKLIPALKEFPNDIIVTADDDIYYPQNWLEILYKAYLADPTSIHCHRAYKIKFDIDGHILPYEKWNHRFLSQGSSFFHFFPTGGGGILYPAGSLSSEVSNKEVFEKTAYDTDDIWFWVMAVLNGTKTHVSEDSISKPIAIEGTQNIGLWEVKNSLGNNDANFIRVFKHYPQLKELLKFRSP